MQDGFLLGAAETYRGASKFGIAKIPIIIRLSVSVAGTLGPTGAPDAFIFTGFRTKWILLRHEGIVILIIHTNHSSTP